MASLLSLGERVHRARRIGTVFGRIYLGIKANQFVARSLRPPDMRERWSRFNRQSARSIFDVAVELRGMILKGCQFLGARADVLPPEYVEVLSRLQDRVPPRSFPAVRRVLEHDFGAPLEDVYESFGEHPIASASLAQVHEAVLHGGRRVAVKVQYPEIAALVKSDLANLRTLFRAVGALERDVDLMPLVDELGTHVPRELDFENEGRNAETVAKMFAHRDDVRVPEIVWEHTTRRVLTMEFMEGIKITDVEALAAAGVDPQQVVQLLVDAYAVQVFQHGFFHADPHPGNLLVQPDGPRLVMLDFGLSKDLPATFREGVVRFAGAMIQEDAEGMVQAFLDLGFETRDGSDDSLVEVARFALEFARRVRERTSGDPRLFERWNQELPELVRQNPVVRIPSHVVLMGRALGLLSGVSRSLGARIDLLRAVLPYVMGVTPTPAP